jgi:hypothetical protein
LRYETQKSLSATPDEDPRVMESPKGMILVFASAAETKTIL